MGKNLKRKREQKAKVKIKESKTLFKGQNVTDTNFKVRKIVIKEQLKDVDETQALTSRKLNLKDLQNRLNHYSSSARLDALLGLQELLNNYPKEIYLHLSSLIDKILKTTNDIEKDVRKEGFKLIKLIFNNLDENQLTPHFHIVLPFLNCSMTHINPSIQEDSLKLVDIFLENIPNLMAKNADKILGNFINMISKLNSDLHGKRNLSLNLGEKITSVQWRLQVLCRLHKLLEAMAMKKDQQFKYSQKSKEFNAKNIKFISLYTQVSDNDSSLMSLLNPATCEDSLPDNLTKIKNFTNVLLPLLFESWAEVKNEKNLDKMISQDASLFLYVILHIILFIWNYLSKCEEESKSTILREWFKNKFQAEITNYFMPLFPYCEKEKKNLNANSKEILTMFNIKSEQNWCQITNLILIYLISTFQEKANPEICQNITNYLQKNITNFMPSKEATPYFIDCLRNVLLIRGEAWEEAGANISELTTTLINFHLKTHYDQLFFILIDLVLEKNQSSLEISASFTEWLKRLPYLLCKSSLSLNGARQINKLASRNNAILIQGLKNHEQQIQESKKIHDDSIKSMIDNILFWIHR